jgi:hypothetical protein
MREVLVTMLTGCLLFVLSAINPLCIVRECENNVPIRGQKVVRLKLMLCSSGAFLRQEALAGQF